MKDRYSFGSIVLVVFLLFLVTQLTACGGGGGGGGSVAASKPLFSVWTSAENPNATMDLTGLSFGVNNFIYHELYTNAGCVCPIVLAGNESAGEVVYRVCAWTGPAQSQCYMNNTHYSYSNTNAVLTICNLANNECETFR